MKPLLLVAFLLMIGFASSGLGVVTPASSWDANGLVIIDVNSGNLVFPDGSVVSTLNLPNQDFVTSADIASLRFPQTRGYLVEFTDKPTAVYATENAKATIEETSAYYSALQQKRIDYLQQVNQSIPGLLGTKEFDYDLVFFGSSFPTLTAAQAKTLEDKKFPFIKRVHQNKIVKTLLTQSVPQINANQVWQLRDGQGNAVTGRGVKIAVIDTGVDYTQPELGGCFGAGCKVADGYDFINNDSNPMDDHGHGTHVAATAAGKAVAGNSNTLNGVAPEATIYAYKVLDRGGSGSWSQVIAGIERATDPNYDGDTSDHVDVINLSLGGEGNPDDPISTAVDRAVNKGVIVVVAAGNDGPGPKTIGSPGTARKAITVAAACKPQDIGVNPYCDDGIASFSSRGPVVWKDEFGFTQTIEKPDISAPGVMICAAQWDDWHSDRPCNPASNNHIAISGTSMATPHVAGVAALIKQYNPTLTPPQVKRLLKRTAQDLGYSSRMQGAGLINAVAAAGSPLFGSDTIALNDSPTQKMATLIATSELNNQTTSAINAALSVENTNPGMSVSLNTTTLLVPANGAANYSVTFIVDHDVAIAETTLGGNIVYSIGSNVIGKTPFSVLVEDSVQVTPTEILSIDNPNIANWVDTKNIQLKNVRTDASQTVNFVVNPLQCKNCPPPSGVTLTMLENNIPTNQVILQPNQTKTIQAKVEINNSILPTKAYYWDSIEERNKLGVYYQTIMVSTPKQVDKTIQYSFSKCHAIRFNWSETPIEVRVQQSSLAYERDPLIRIIEDGLYCDENPKTVDVVTIFDPDETATQTLVVNENVPLSGDVPLTIDKSTATHLIEFYHKDIKNQPNHPEWGFVFARHFQESQPIFARTICGGLDWFGNFTECNTPPLRLKFNTVSSNYLLYYQAYTRSATIEDRNNYLYQYDLNGINASQRFENNASDFKKTSVVVEHSGQVDQYIRGAALRSFECAGACLLRSIRFLEPPTNDFLLNVIPFSNAFSPNPRTAFSYGVTTAHQVNPTNVWGDVRPFISPGSQFTQQKIRRVSNLTHDVFPDQYGGYWVIGYAPPFFRGLISSVANTLHVGKVNYNNRTEYFLTPSFDTIGHKLSDYKANVLIPYELYDSTNRLVQSGSLFEGINAPQLSIQLPTAGRYSLELLKNYNVLDSFNTLGENYTATTTATVDTTQLSSKAPVFEMVGYDVNGKPSNQVNFRKGTNQLKFSVVPVPGTTFNVSLEFGSSAAGIPMQGIPLTASGSTYEGMIPNVRSVSVVPANFKITVTDNTSNQLVYDFQLPITAISSGIKNNGSSTIKGIVKIVVQKKQNDGTWNTVQTVYNQEQTISPNSTFFVSDVFNPVTVTLSNKGNYRVKEGFYRQLSGGGLDPLQSTDGSMEYTKTFTIS